MRGGRANSVYGTNRRFGMDHNPHQRVQPDLNRERPSGAQEFEVENKIPGQPLRLSGNFVLVAGGGFEPPSSDRKSTRLNSSHVAISYAVFCLKKKKHHTRTGV